MRHESSGSSSQAAGSWHTGLSGAAVPRLLLVDDDPAVLQVIPQLLQLRLRTLVIEATGSSLQALEWATTRPYDVILSDLKMPGLDGLALLCQIRAQHVHTPVLLLTGHGDDAVIEQAFASGAYLCLRKPCDRLLLSSCVERAVEYHQLLQKHARLEMAAGSVELLRGRAAEVSP